MTVHHHVLEMKRQLDSLYQIVEQLQSSVPTNGNLPAGELAELMPQLSNESLGLEMNVGNNNFQHKDILFDETALLEGHPVDDKAMTPDIQIKRLTAQLTVAYKRIAQLEEQLLSRQNHHNGSEYIYS